METFQVYVIKSDEFVILHNIKLKRNPESFYGYQNLKGYLLFIEKFGFGKWKIHKTLKKTFLIFNS